MSARNAYGGPRLGAASGMGAFGWLHGFRATEPTAIPDAYTPAPVLRHATSSSARSSSRSRSIYGHYEQEKARGPTNWPEPDWRSSQQTFADEIPRYHSGPPQLPAIQIYASSRSDQADAPPPLPPKQLFPGRLGIHAPRAYTPPYGSSSLESESSLPPSLGTEAHTSLNVISDYTQASPAPPQPHRLCSNEQASEPHALPPGLLRVQTNCRLETLAQREENDKPLPIRSEDSGGTICMVRCRRQ